MCIRCGEPSYLVASVDVIAPGESASPSTFCALWRGSESQRRRFRHAGDVRAFFLTGTSVESKCGVPSPSREGPRKGTCSLGISSLNRSRIA